jgi:hypothetical protein
MVLSHGVYLVPSDECLSRGSVFRTVHLLGSTSSNAFSNSNSWIGKLFPELYHLVSITWRNAPAEEHFLNLRTLLLHIYSAVALDAPAKDRCKQERLERNSKKGNTREWSIGSATRRSSEVSGDSAQTLASGNFSGVEELNIFFRNRTTSQLLLYTP